MPHATKVLEAAPPAGNFKKGSKRKGKASIKESKPGEKPISKLGKSSTNSKETEAIVAKIRDLQGRESQSKGELIQLQLEIGEQLNSLKKTVAHGKWGKLLSKLGYEERTAQKLMKVSREKFADKIRDLDPVLTRRLPTDVYKLDLLNQLNKTQLKRCLKSWGKSLPAMSRSELRTAVKGAPEPHKVNQESEGASSSEANSEESGDGAAETKEVMNMSEQSDEASAAGEQTPGLARAATSGASDPLAALKEACGQLHEEKVRVEEAIKSKQITKTAAQQAIVEINKTAAGLKQLKQSLACIR